MGIPKPALSVPIIARDEEENLPSLFASLKPLRDTGRVQFIVLDTGSADRTREIAGDFGCEVETFAWTDDFSAARNRALALCRAPWFLWLDADDVLPPATASTLIASLGDWDTSMAYAFRVRSPGPDGSSSEFTQIRLAPADQGLAFRNPVHESLGESVRDLGLKVGATGLEILHRGYRDAREVDRKRRRNLALLEKALQSADASSTLLLAHARMCLGLGRPAEAEGSLRRALATADPDTEPALAARVHLGQSLLFQGRNAEAVEAFEAGLARAGSDAQYLLEYGKALWMSRRGAEARAAWRSCLEAHPSPTSIPTDWMAVTAGARKLLKATAVEER